MAVSKQNTLTLMMSTIAVMSHHKAQQDIKIHQCCSQCIEMKSLEQ